MSERRLRRLTNGTYTVHQPVKRIATSLKEYSDRQYHARY
jgi:hypothetical protein